MKLFMHIILILVSTFYLSALNAKEVTASKVAEPKNQEDPTKIVTKVGLGYNGDLVLSGSFALSQTNKVNGSINSEGDEWRIGGSWLLSKGIVNFNVDVDDFRKSFSVGTYVPLSVFGVDTGEWMLFPLAGVSSTQGQRNENNIKPDKTYGGYAGMFFLRPINNELTLMGWGVGGLGSNDYSSIGLGAGLSYKIDLYQSVNVVSFYSDDVYRTDTTFGINYRFEFN